MPRRDKTKPFVFFFLVLPYGISSGFVSITLPFVLTHDRSGTGWMLQTDARSSILFVVAALFVLHKINAARAQSLAADNGRVG